MNKNNKTSTGFTLIELLVVIAIIGLLSTLAVVSLNSARLKARDAKRVADIKQVQTALELYFNDSSSYPIMASGGTTLGGTAAGAYTCLDATSGFATGGCTSPYMGLLPANPTPNGTPYVYTSSPSAGGDCTSGICSTYELTLTLEGTTGGLQAGLHTASQDGLQ